MFSFCFSLKLECEKLASEKIEIQRHYVMVSDVFIKTAFPFELTVSQMLIFPTRKQQVATRKLAVTTYRLDHDNKTCVLSC